MMLAIGLGIFLGTLVAAAIVAAAGSAMNSWKHHHPTYISIDETAGGPMTASQYADYLRILFGAKEGLK